MLAVERGTESLDRMAATQRAMVKIAGPVDLPRTRPNPFPGGNPRELGAWPLFVTFDDPRSEEHTSELQSLMRISYAVFCLKKKNKSPSILTESSVQPYNS